MTGQRNAASVPSAPQLQARTSTPAGSQVSKKVRRAAAGVAAGVVASGALVAGVVGLLPMVAAGCIAVPFLGAGVVAAVSASRSTSPLAAVSQPELSAVQILAELDATVTAAREAVPPMVAARLDTVVGVVRETVPRLATLGPGSIEAYTVLATASSYLPEALNAYLRLPRRFADNRPVSSGKTSLMVLCDQLDLLAAQMELVYDAACRADADALVAHGRFLADKFASGSLALDPSLRGV